jgi:hypothetical protein
MPSVSNPPTIRALCCNTTCYKSVIVSYKTIYKVLSCNTTCYKSVILSLTKPFIKCYVVILPVTYSAIKCYVVMLSAANAPTKY